MPSGHNKHLADSRAATPVSNSAKFVQLELTAIGIFLVQLAKTMLRFGAFPVCFLLFRFWFTGLTAIYKLLRNSSRYNCQNKINQPWLTMLVMTTMWSTGRHQQSWTGNLTGATGGSRRWYISKGGTAFNEPGWGQLHIEPYIRPISCHVTSLPWQEPDEELN